jgi:multidrug efflux pump
MEVSRMARYNQDQVVFIPIYPEPGTSEILVGDLVYEAVEKSTRHCRLTSNSLFPLIIRATCARPLRRFFSRWEKPFFWWGWWWLRSWALYAAPSCRFDDSHLHLGRAAAMSLMGFSLNLLTILAVVLSVGLVVDDAIVVVENVARNLREGMSRRDAALASSRALVLTDHCHDHHAGRGVRAHRFCVWFVWRAVPGVRFYLGGCGLISGFVAMTLSPLMSAWVCPDKGHETRMSAG